ncbi:hypothetical protein [Nostoc sp.]|uniref:hypothetical protein n=1 Tax=Nostoc sp. TaxID=1180 RepID=UPI002FF6B540
MNKSQSIKLLESEGWTKADAMRALEVIDFSGNADEITIRRAVSAFARTSHVIISAESYQELINRLEESEDMVFGQAAETALSQSTMIGTEAFTSALEHLANGET